MAEERPKALPVQVPRETVNDESVKIVNWIAADGAFVSAGQVVVEIETSKTILEIEAPASGYLRYKFKEGAEVAIRGILCYISASADEPLPKEDEGASAAPKAAGGETRFSRKALELLEQHGLDRELFQGRGLVRENDVLGLLNEKPAVSVRKEPLSKEKLGEMGAFRLGDGNVLTSVVSLVSFASVSPDFKEPAAVVCAVGKLLRRHPIFNSFYHDGAAYFYDAVNIGFAMDAGRGLEIPVVRDADKKNAGDVKREIEGFRTGCREGRLSARSLEGGTFTVMDLSLEGAPLAAPPVYPGQAATLGAGTAFLGPKKDARAAQLILAFDHRLTEGRAAARFLKDLRALLER